MLRTRLLVTTKRTYSNFSFLSNEQPRHIFDQEKLTPEQNKAAIPKKPNFENIPKRYFEIINPEDVNDLVTKLTMDDMLVTILSKDKYLYGDKGHSVRDMQGKPTNAQLPYANVAISWKKVFNEKIFKLDSIHKDTTILSGIPKQISQQLDNCNVTDIKKMFQVTRAKENSQKKLEGELTPLDLLSCITIERLTLYLLGKSVPMTELISYLYENCQYCTSKELTTVISKLVDVHDEAEPVFVKFVVKCVDTQFESVKHLSSSKLDKLAYILAKSNHIPQALLLLRQLIEQRNNPSQKTLNEVLQNFQTVNQTEIIHRLSFLKPVLLTNELTNTTFEILLKSVVDIHDLNKLISLSRSYPEILEHYQNNLLSLLLSLNNRYPHNIRRLQLSQFLRTLKLRQIKFNKQFVDLVQNEHVKLS